MKAWHYGLIGAAVWLIYNQLKDEPQIQAMSGWGQLPRSKKAYSMLLGG